MRFNLPAGGNITAHYMGDDTTEFTHTNIGGDVTSTVYLDNEDAAEMLTNLRVLTALAKESN